MEIPPIIDTSWHEYLQPLFDDPKMLLIKNNVLPKCNFYPESGDIFKVFRMPIEHIKVVLLGQDPYFNGAANGLAFATDSNKPIPKSLMTIKNEILISKANTNVALLQKSMWRTLYHWEAQGVFLLNTALTVEVGNAGSHLGQWMWFTREVIKIISNKVDPIWVLWGSKAKAFKDYIYTDTNKPVIIEGNHPSAESYQGSKYKFTGCNHFNIINEFLEKRKVDSSINW